MRLLLLAGLLRLVVALRVYRWSLRMGTGAGERKRLPVTVISGIQGAGKTTLLKHILDPDNRGYSSRYAVIVNDMSDGLHIDETLTLTAQEEMVQMNNGCVCCTLHDDLLLEVTRLALKGVYDHLIIESSGVSEPLSVAEALTFRTEDGETESLCDLVEIDTMVTVVDAASFIRDMAAAEELVDRGIAIDEGDTRTITDLLVAQVEFADVVIINKIDKVSVRQFNKVNQIVRSLNADAAILSSQNSKINLEEIFNARRFDFTRTAESPTWLQAINGDTKKQPEAEDSGVRSFIYRARRPFHPSRLFAFLSGRLNREGETDKAFDIAYPEVLRSKGFFWLASRPTEMLIWSQAGGLFQLSPGGIWLADSSDEIKEAALAEAEMDWTSEEGDRRQELVFIGADMDEADLSAALDACLLTSAEVQLSADSWEDPFPPSEYADSLEHDHDHDHEHDHDHGHMFV